MKVKLLIFALWVLTTTSGCTVLKKQSDGPRVEGIKNTDKQRFDNVSTIESQLLLTAQSIEQSLITLAAAEKVEHPPTLNTESLVTPEGGLGGLADVDWTGPIGPLVEKIASMTNYRVKVLGIEPPIPILVSITAKKTAIADILQNASLQAGKRAHILVFPSSRLIEVRYLS